MFHVVNVAVLPPCPLVVLPLLQDLVLLVGRVVVEARHGFPRGVVELPEPKAVLHPPLLRALLRLLVAFPFVVRLLPSTTLVCVQVPPRLVRWSVTPLSVAFAVTMVVPLLCLATRKIVVGVLLHERKTWFLCSTAVEGACYRANAVALQLHQVLPFLVVVVRVLLFVQLVSRQRPRVQQQHREHWSLYIKQVAVVLARRYLPVEQL